MGVRLLPRTLPELYAHALVMERDATRMRGARPFVFTNLRDGTGVDTVVHCAASVQFTLRRMGRAVLKAVADKEPFVREVLAQPRLFLIGTDDELAGAAR